jgi:hypothetical protein
MADNLVSIPAETLAALQNAAAQAQATIAAKESEARAADARAMISRGETEAVLKRHQTEIAETKAKTAKLAVATELSRALASQPLNPHAVSQLETILGSELVADETPTGFSVRTRDFRDVNSYVASRLATPEFAHFKANGGQSAPATASNPAPAPAQPAQPQEPRNYGEAILFQAAAAKAAREAASTSDPRTDMSRGIGLGKGAATNTFAQMVKALSLR